MNQNNDKSEGILVLLLMGLALIVFGIWYIRAEIAGFQKLLLFIAAILFLRKLIPIVFALTPEGVPVNFFSLSVFSFKLSMFMLYVLSDITSL